MHREQAPTLLSDLNLQRILDGNAVTGTNFEKAVHSADCDEGGVGKVWHVQRVQAPRGEIHTLLHTSFRTLTRRLLRVFVPSQNISA